MKNNNWMNRLWALALSVCLLLANVPGLVWAAEPAVETDAIYLSTPEDLLELARQCVSDAWSRDKVVVLNNDIDLTGIDFGPIPTFGGVFLGGGHRISGLKLSGEMTALGFFRYLQKTAVVEDLHLEGSVHPSGGSPDVGGLVGVNRGTVRDCSFTGTVSGPERIGGIAGQNKVTGILENCTVSGTVFGDHYIGGIAGENLGVIRDCVNRAEVNTHVDHNSVSAVMSGLSMDSFTLRESISDATNIGGIAGTSSGVIRGCENRAPVGYPKMGYNVGGIAGSQIGYLTECANYGAINGSNGVGGIVGQFRPNVVLNTGENHMSDLMDQMIGLMGSMSGMMGSMQGLMTDMDRMHDSVELLKDPENWDPDSLNAAFNEMNTSFQGLYQNMLTSGSRMTGQMQGMMGSMSGMVETMGKINEGLNIRIIDISREDTPEDTQSKVSLCTNFGPVWGEVHVGGIAGTADIEDTTAQKDIQSSLNLSTEGEMVMRLVIRDCRNTGLISASGQYAGGIVGSMTIGALFGGRNTGGLNGLNGSYIGGIAGRSDAYIAHCISRSIVAGHQYVGGIAGFGTEVTGCHAISRITAAGGYAGGILGKAARLPEEQEGLILDNRYYLSGKNQGGIDGISYAGAAEPMTLPEFLSLEGLDDMFRQVKLCFASEGQEDTVLTVELGGSLPEAQIPRLETGDRQQYQWVLRQAVATEQPALGQAPAEQILSPEDLTDILFDQTYEARFDAKNTVVASVQTTESGRPLALAVGAFDGDAGLHLTEITDRADAPDGLPVQESWLVILDGGGIEKLHYRIPQELEPQRIALYVRDQAGRWTQRDFVVEGSYMIFSFAGDDAGFALAQLPREERPATALIAGAAAVVLLAAVRLCKSRGKKEKPGEA